MNKGDPPQISTVCEDKGFGSSSPNNGAKVWVERPNGPPKAAGGTALGKDNTVGILKPGQE